MAAIQRLILSQKPLSGFLHIKDYFSIYPVHQWVNLNEQKSFLRYADRDADLFGPPYPLYFEIEHPGEMCAEWYQQAFMKLERYERLACLLIFGIESAAHQSPNEQWVSFVKAKADALNISYGLTSFGFSVDGEASLARFIKEGGLPATPFVTKGDVAYYDALHRSDHLDFPVNLEDMMRKYEALQHKWQRNFDRAAFFFHQGEFLLKRQFAPLTSYASAVECLLSKQSEKCHCCGLDKYGVSRRFKDFVAEFAPVSEAIGSHQDRMYSHRSKETHGRSTPHTDREGMFKSFDSNRYMFPWIIRKALVNWLISCKLQDQ